ncbi:Fur family transcriptional regulator [Marinithermus hydrothermalis]|uniref:Ferric uptake regulator, Fur family n=1 Tax=Marinithermus hydrothermalis (strain DSM 14884 / JCM 11576 / T1) TaxID=869210 RepID=F2NM69_MARHT|nr:transcriptional repressor [Marinithermus hydrothermalis]AEB11539.1 ferric uptake regulator, Fur family [Marinithermus hydrothermalis DSM 14884]
MGRDTLQRRAIRNAFLKANRPLSPQEVLESARAEAPRLGIATVYRTIKHLREEGWLTVVELPGESPRYEIAGKHHHHHFHCRTCGRVYELEGCPVNMHKLAPSGFRPEGHELVLYGVCAECDR